MGKRVIIIKKKQGMKTFEEVKEHLRNEAYFTDEVKTIKAFLRGAGFTKEQLDELDFSKDCNCSYDFVDWFLGDVEEEKEIDDEPKFKVTIDGKDVEMTSDEIHQAIINNKKVGISDEILGEIISRYFFNIVTAALNEVQESIYGGGKKGGLANEERMKLVKEWKELHSLHLEEIDEDSLSKEDLMVVRLLGSRMRLIETMLDGKVD